MRVCLVSGSYPPVRDGVGDYVQRLFHELRGHPEVQEVILITSVDDSVDDEPGVLRAVDSWGPAGTLAVLRILKRTRPDVVNIQYQTRRYGRCLAIAFLPWLIRFLLPGVRVVSTVHEFSNRRLMGKLRVLVSLVMSHKVIIVTPRYRHDLSAFWPPLSRKLCYVPVGATLLPQEVDPAEVQRMRARWSLTQETPVVCYFGVIRPSKGLEFLLAAFAELLHVRPDARLLLIGHSDPTYHRTQFLPLVNAHRLHDHLALTGRCSERDLSHYFALADLCVLPFGDGVSSRRTSFMAAMQHGLAVITTRPASPFEELVDGENVVLVEYGDTRALAACIQMVLDDAELRRRLGDNLQGLRDTFGWPAIAARAMNVFSAAAHREATD